MKIKYWLIYADWEGRKAKPFTDLGVMERWIEIIESNPSMTIIAKTQTIEEGESHGE